MAFQKGLLYSLLTGLLTGSYALTIILFNQLCKGTSRTGSILFFVFFFFVIVFVFEPLKRRVQLVIDRLLFKGKYDYQRTLMALSDAMASMLNLEEIMEKTLRGLTEVMRLEWSYVMLMDGGAHRFRVHRQMGSHAGAEGLSISRSSPLIKEMGCHRKEVTQYNIEEWADCCNDPSSVRRDFDKLGGTAIIPMVFQAQINGLLVLGNKKSGDLFTSEDFEMLRSLANQCTVAIENAKAYQLIEMLNMNLEKMVEERTEELKKALDDKDRTQDLLIRSESLAAVGALVAGVAHELNNPLASVSSLVQSVVEILEARPAEQGVGSGEDPEEREELVDDLRFTLKELGRAKDIVASLLGISRQTEEYTEPVAINEVCKDALRVLYN